MMVCKFFILPMMMQLAVRNERKQL